MMQTIEQKIAIDSLENQQSNTDNKDTQNIDNVSVKNAEQADLDKAKLEQGLKLVCEAIKFVSNKPKHITVVSLINKGSDINLANQDVLDQIVIASTDNNEIPFACTIRQKMQDGILLFDLLELADDANIEQIVNEKFTEQDHQHPNSRSCSEDRLVKRHLVGKASDHILSYINKGFQEIEAKNRIMMASMEDHVHDILQSLNSLMF